MTRAVVVLVLLTIAAVSGAAELTVEEYVRQYPEEAAKDVAEWEAVKAATPVVTLPAAAIVVTGRDVAVAWQGSIDMTIAGILHYLTPLPPVVAQGVLPAPLAWWVVPAWTAGGMAAGALLVTLTMAILHALGGP